LQDEQPRILKEFTAAEGILLCVLHQYSANSAQLSAVSTFDYLSINSRDLLKAITASSA